VLPRPNRERALIFERFEAEHSALERERRRSPPTPCSKATFQGVVSTGLSSAYTRYSVLLPFATGDGWVSC